MLRIIFAPAWMFSSAISTLGMLIGESRRVFRNHLHNTHRTTRISQILVQPGFLISLRHHHQIVEIIFSSHIS